MKYFQKKVIWITGASSGIGKELALSFSKMPQTFLIISARREDKLQEVKNICTSNGAPCEVLVLDLENTEVLEQKANDALQIFGRIDILIHNGGISQRSSVIETPIQNDRKIMEIDYFSTVILTKSVLPSMVANNFGHIVVNSSISGIFGFPMRSAYCAAKHALYGFYESLDIEMRSQGIFVTIASPGRIQTDISFSALTKDGSLHGKLDDGQKNGMPVDVCVEKLLKAISKQKHEVLIGGKELILAQIYRKCPWLFHRIARKIKAT